MSLASKPFSPKPSNYDELSMQESLHFSESLNDLKNLRAQLYSAAEYFEVSYMNDDQKRLVVDTLKEYAVTAIINTVDHLGSVSFKVNGSLDQSVEKVSGLEVQVSCMEQRLRTCQNFIDGQGQSQQSLILSPPKYHKRYLLPVGENLGVSGRAVLKHQWCNLDDEDDWHQIRNAVRSSLRGSPPSATRKGRSPSPSPRPPYLPPGTTFSFTEKQTILENRGVSPYRAKFPFVRTGPHLSRSTTPVGSRSTTPVSSRPTAPNSTNTRQRYPSEPKKSGSMGRLRAEKENVIEAEQYPTKSKRLLKALLNRGKSRKDDSLYTFLDEY